MGYLESLEVYTALHRVPLNAIVQVGKDITLTNDEAIFGGGFVRVNNKALAGAGRLQAFRRHDDRIVGRWSCHLSGCGDLGSTSCGLK